MFRTAATSEIMVPVTSQGRMDRNSKMIIMILPSSFFVSDFSAALSEALDSFSGESLSIESINRTLKSISVEGNVNFISIKHTLVKSTCNL